LKVLTMNILILGGTVFLGRHLVEAAIARGHRVTLFNRGQHNPELYPDVEKLRGDRDGDLSVLQGRRWDAAIDTCGYIPRHVRASAGLLAGAVDHYTFISSISVYADFRAPGVDESDPVGTLEDTTVEEITGETYGPLKALCEQAAEQAMPGRVLQVRPGLIVGPHDPTDRFTYWPTRVARGGEVLAPGQPHAPVQFIDARDLAKWTVRMVEARQTGTYNATGPDYELELGRLLEECKAVSGSDARLVWADESFLLGAGVGPWIELPLWIAGRPAMAHLQRVSIRRATDAGLTFRPLAETIRDTLEWDATRPAEEERGAGLKPEREVELLRAWRAQGSA
jgi:2'-hydroxyisoflavone reductase